MKINTKTLSDLRKIRSVNWKQEDAPFHNLIMKFPRVFFQRNESFRVCNLRFLHFVSLAVGQICVDKLSVEMIM